MTDNQTRYKVLISTTDEGLRDFAEACSHATWKAGHCGWARFSFSEEDITSCEVFVSICRAVDDSVQRDCSLAAVHEKRILFLVLSADSHHGVPALRTLKGGALDGTMVCHVSSQNEALVSEYLACLHRIVRRLDLERAPSEAAISPYIPNPFVQRLVQGAQRWRVLNARCKEHVVLKTAIADFVWDRYLPLFAEAQIYNFFIESGSSPALLSERLSRRLEEDWAKLSVDLDVETNNVLAFWELMSTESIRVGLYPAGPAEGKYGATFGPLRAVTPQPLGAPIDGDSLRYKNEIRDHLEQVYKDKGVILAATSGIELSTDSPYPGPHVGSYHNMLFKRAYMESGAPIIILLDESKLLCPFNPEKCYPVCDADFPWERVCQEVPIALGCAFRNQEAGKELLPNLERLGFRHLERERNSDIPWCMIASNDKFWQNRERWIQDSGRETIVPREALPTTAREDRPRIRVMHTLP